MKDDSDSKSSRSLSSFVAIAAFAEALGYFFRSPKNRSGIKPEIHLDRYLLVDTAFKEIGSTYLPHSLTGPQPVVSLGDAWIGTSKNRETWSDPLKNILFFIQTHRHCNSSLTTDGNVHAIFYDDFEPILLSIKENFSSVSNLLPKKYSAELFHYAADHSDQIKLIGTLSGTGEIIPHWIQAHQSLCIFFGQQIKHIIDQDSRMRQSKTFPNSITNLTKDFFNLALKNVGHLPLPSQPYQSPSSLSYTLVEGKSCAFSGTIVGFGEQRFLSRYEDYMRSLNQHIENNHLIKSTPIQSMQTALKHEMPNGLTIVKQSLNGVTSQKTTHKIAYMATSQTKHEVGSIFTGGVDGMNLCMVACTLWIEKLHAQNSYIRDLINKISAINYGQDKRTKGLFKEANELKKTLPVQRNFYQPTDIGTVLGIPAFNEFVCLSQAIEINTLTKIVSIQELTQIVLFLKNLTDLQVLYKGNYPQLSSLSPTLSEGYGALITGNGHTTCFWISGLIQGSTQGQCSVAYFNSQHEEYPKLPYDIASYPKGATIATIEIEYQTQEFLVESIKKFIEMHVLSRFQNAQDGYSIREYYLACDIIVKRKQIQLSTDQAAGSPYESMA